jgi:hypothetical protein
MPGNPTIDLDVRNFPSNGSDGYTNTTASNNAIYSYKYSGGTGNGGDVTFTSRGRVTIVVQLQSDPRYTINSITFSNDVNNQLSLVSNPHAQTTATIQNLNNLVQTADYKVSVSDSSAGCTFPCDPQIINR